MRLTVLCAALCAAAMFLTAGGNASAQAIVPEISHYMVIIATSTSAGAANIQMTTLTFPSERACAAAAAIFGQSTAGANVVARCAPQR